MILRGCSKIRKESDEGQIVTGVSSKCGATKRLIQVSEETDG